MKKSVILVFLVIFCVTLSFNIQTTVAQTSPSTTRVPILRLYNPNSGEHLFTMRGAEVEILCHIGWRYEGSAWEVQNLQALIGIQIPKNIVLFTVSTTLSLASISTPPPSMKKILC